MRSINKRVLIFTYYWPPAGGASVQRFLKFSKFLPEHGWEPVIVTVKNGAYAYNDESLLKEVLPATQVYHTKTFEPFELYNMLRGQKGKALPLSVLQTDPKKSFFQNLSEFIRANFFIPDARKGWVPYAVRQAEEILATQKIDAIITTGPPHSTHLTGLALKKKYNIKWIADLRDPWTRIFYNELLPRRVNTIKKDAALEREVLQTADMVTVISPGMKRQFAGITDNIQVVYNGYDDDDFTATETTMPPQKIFTIRYIGNLMSNQNVTALWKALAMFRSKTGPIKIEFVGRVDDPVKQSIRDEGLDDIATYLNFVAHKQAIEFTKKSSLLILIIQNVRDRHLFLNSKLFEYISSGTEILSIGPIDGDAAVVLNTANRKPMVDYSNYEAMLQQLLSAYQQWQQDGVDFKYTDNSHLIFTRRNQTTALVKILNQL